MAYYAYLPELVPEGHVVEGNSKLEASQAVAEIAGPSLAGAIVQWLSAPLALVLDAASFLVSALCLLWVRAREGAPVAPGKHPSIWKQIAEGFRVIVERPVLRAIAGCSSILNFFETILSTLYTLYVVNELHISAALLGVILGVGSVGGLLGALIATRVARWKGIGPALLLTTVMSMVGALLLPLAQGPMVVPLLIVGRFLMGMSATIYNVNQLSLRQMTTPTVLQGRVNATIRFLAGGSVPPGALLGGLLGTWLGLRTTLILVVARIGIAFVWLLCSSVRGMVKPERTL
nr:MFS transporter [Thermosporothrix hazakensis]